MKVPKWLKSIFKTKRPVLLEVFVARELPTKEEKKIRKAKRTAQKRARRMNRS